MPSRGRRRQPPLVLFFVLQALAFTQVLSQSSPDHSHPAIFAGSDGSSSTLALPSPSTSAGTTIPAFPEQSDAAGITEGCPLRPIDSLLPALSTCKSNNKALPSVASCCPALAAWVYAAYAPTALSSSAAAAGMSSTELPVLPEDTEACVGSVDRELRLHDVQLSRLNGTCDAALCYCGIRPRRLACAAGGAFAVKNGRWAPTDPVAQRLGKECSRPGIAGCSRCLRALNQLSSGSASAAAGDQKGVSLQQAERDCQIMSLTWLLEKNGTLYQAAAIGVLRAIMAADNAGIKGQITSCAVSANDIPLAVDSGQISSSGSRIALSFLLSMELLPLLYFSFVILVCF